MTLMIRSNKAPGYEPYAGKSLPPDFVPWGVLAGCVPVYAKRGSPSPAGDIKPYIPATQKLRRGMCEEALASLVSQKRGLVDGGLTPVNEGVEEYMRFQIAQSSKGGRVKRMARSLNHAMYSDTYWDGRLGPASARPGTALETIENAITTMKTASVPKVLNIHSSLAFGFFKKLGGVDKAQEEKFDECMKELRPKDLFAVRGRKTPLYEGPVSNTGQKPGVLPTTRGGILAENDPRGGWKVDERVRGVDEWEEDLDNPSPFAEDMRAKNLIFVAGPSGTTIALLTVAKVFGDLGGELLKQYVLACVGFLVEGGHHSYHEVMVIAAVAGCPYRHGQFSLSLPQSFLNAPEYKTWELEYYDIVMNLGS